MRKYAMLFLLVGALVFIGCRSKTGRQNIQYVHPVEDTTAFNDFEESDGVEEWAEDPIIDVGVTPQEDDYKRLHSREGNDEMEDYMRGR